MNIVSYPFNTIPSECETHLRFLEDADKENPFFWQTQRFIDFKQYGNNICVPVKEPNIIWSQIFISLEINCHSFLN